VSKEDDIRADVTRLPGALESDRGQGNRDQGEGRRGGGALYEEPDVLVKVIRDLFNEDFNGLIVSGDEAWNTINEYVNSVAPDLVSKLTKIRPAAGPEGRAGPDVFAVHRIDEQLGQGDGRKVWLPSGGTLVIDRTEAMTVRRRQHRQIHRVRGNLEARRSPRQPRSGRGGRAPAAAARPSAASSSSTH